MPTMNLDELARLRDAKWLSCQRHPQHPLTIWNYTPKCQWERAWTPETLMCRGLVTDDTGNIIARPFPKFFNWDEHENPALGLPPINWAQEFVATEKMDGALGIAFHYGGEWHLATRGSFTSPQADEARAIARDRFYRFPDLPRIFTYCFEIISPATRVVVDYGKTREMVLLEAIRTETGEGVPLVHLGRLAGRIGCRGVSQYVLAAPDPGNLADFAAKEARNAEGIVIRFDDGTRVKAKFDEYKRLHRLVTGVNTKAIWEAMASGRPEDVDRMMERVPDEFADWVNAKASDMLVRAGRLRQDADIALGEIITRLTNSGVPSRKEYAVEILKHGPLSAAMFRILDRKSADEAIWKLIKPARVEWFCEDEEADHADA